MQRYYTAIEFAAIALEHSNNTASAKINTLSNGSISAGIDNIEEFADIIPQATDAMVTAKKHLEKVQHELENVLRPMQVAFEASVGHRPIVCCACVPFRIPLFFNHFHSRERRPVDLFLPHTIVLVSLFSRTRTSVGFLSGPYLQ